MFTETQQINLKSLLLDDMKIGPEHLPDKPKQIKDLLLGEDCDEDFSLAEEDLS